MSHVRKTLGEAVRTVVESLEKRTLLTTVTLPGSEDPDSYGAYLNTSTNNVDFYINASPGNGSPYQSVPASEVTKLVIAETGDPTDGGNSLTVDTSGASFELQVTGNNSLDVIVDAGSVTVNTNQSFGNLIVGGQFHHTGGVLTVPYIEISSSGLFRDAGGSIASSGGVNVDNYGTFKAAFSGSLAGTTGWFVNEGHVISDVGTGNTATVGMAFYNVDGSFNLVSGTLRVSSTVTAYDSLQIDGTAGTLSVPSHQSKSGGIVQTGGTFHVDGQLRIGQSGTGTTTSGYSISGGKLEADTLLVSDANVTSTLVQSGGTVVVNAANIGIDGKSVNWTMTGGTITASSFLFGQSSAGTSTFNFSGGTFAAGSGVFGTNSQVVVNVSQTASLAVSGRMNIGAWGGTCTFNQSGGSVYIYELFMAAPYSSTGIYNLSSGSLTTSAIYMTKNADWSGDTLHATFNQTGGTHTNNWFVMGQGPNGYAHYNLQAGTLASNYFFMEGNATPVFTQSGGQVTFNSFFVGENGPNTSTYKLTGGSLSVGWAAQIGHASAGRFEQSGGTAQFDRGLIVSGNGMDGQNPNGHGTLVLSGTGSLTTPNIVVGYSANGSVEQTGGSLAIYGQLVKNGPSGSIGTVSFTGGTRNTGVYTVYDVLQPATTGPSTIPEGTPYDLSLIATSDIGYNAITSWSVNWDDTASPGTQAVTGSPAGVQHTYYVGNQSHTINTTAFGGGMSYPTSPKSVFVANVAPVIDPVTSITVDAGQAVNLSAAFTEAGIGQTHIAALDWGDSTITSTQEGSLTLTKNGQIGTVTGTHTFNTHGTYTATIYVTDSLGGVSSRTFTIEVAYVQPTFSLTAQPTQSMVGDTTTLKMKFSGPEAAGVTAWKVDWGDNTINTYSSNAVADSVGRWTLSQTHVYATQGNYTIQAWAIDSQPEPHSAGTVDITVDALPLTSVAAPSAVSGTPTSSTEVELSWHDNSNDEDGFKVYASENGGQFSLLQTLEFSHTGNLPAKAAVTSLTPGSTYAFYVTSYRGTEESSPSKASLVEMPTTDDVSLSIIGPSAVTTNATVRYKAVGPTDEIGDPTYVWSVLLDGKSVKSGQGADFSFIATGTGDYTVQLTRLKANTPPTTISKPLTITNPNEALCTVSGPAVSEVDRISVFNVDITKDMYLGPKSDEEGYVYADHIILDWTARDQDGNVLNTYHGTLSNGGFKFTPRSIGTFDIDVTITRTDGVVGYKGHASTSSTQGTPDTFSKAFVDFGQVKELGNQVIEDAQHRFVVAGSRPLYSEGVDIKSAASTYAATEVLGTIYLTRLKFDLTVDASFGVNGSQSIQLSGLMTGRPVIRELDDGTYLIAGMHGTSSDQTVSFVKIDEHGQLDESFGDDGIANWSVQPRYTESSTGSPTGVLNAIFDMIVDPGGKIYVAGGSHGESPFPDDGTVSLEAVMRFNADGTLDDGSETDSTPNDSFGRNGIAEIPVENFYHRLVSSLPEYATSLLLSPDGSIYVGGTFLSGHSSSQSAYEANFDFSIAKLSNDGYLDTTFGNDGRGYVAIDFGDEFSNTVNNGDQSFRLLSDSKGRLVIVGTSAAEPWGIYLNSDSPHISIARLLPNGSPDPTFGSDPTRPGLAKSSFYGSESAWSAAVTADDKIVVAGASASGGIIARFDTDGSPDESFGNLGKIVLNTVFDATWQSVIIASDNDIVIAGNAEIWDHATNTLTADGFGIAKYHPGDVAATDLTATATVEGPIDLNWVDAGTDEDGFLVLRSTTPGEPSLSNVVGTVAANGTSWVDTTVVPGQRYYYQVVAFSTAANGTPHPGIRTNVATAQAAPKNTGYVLAETVAVPVTGATVESALSLLAGENYKLSVHGYFQIGTSANVNKYADAQYGQYNPLPSEYSQVPKKVQFGIGVNDEQVDLNRFPFWGDPSTDAAHTYSISYSPTTTGKLKLNFHDSYYPDNQPGYYMMVDVYRALPGAPETVNANTDRAHKRIDLTWTNVASDATKILVQRSVNGSAYATVATLPPDSEAYSDPNITFNTKYSYRLIARSAFGDSIPSNEAVAVMVNAPPKIEAIGTMTARAGSEFSFAVNAEDPDDPDGALTYSLGGFAPGEATINANGEVGGWTPSASQIGLTYVWRINVQDADGGTAERYAVVTVAPALSTIPVISTQPYVVSQTDTTADVSVLASDDGPESALSYKWVVQSRPFGVRLPTFSANGTNAAKNTTITFYAAGTYKFQVQASDGTDYDGTAELTITVAPVFSGVQVVNPLATLNLGESYPFTAVALDQFGRNWDPTNPVQPTITWTTSGAAGGQIDSATGLYQAPATLLLDADDTVVATATSGSVVKTAIGNAHVSVGNQAPVIDTDANDEFLIDAEPLNFTQLRLTVVAHDPDEPASDLTYTWTANPVGSPAVTFSVNGNNAASTTIATCPDNEALNYTFTVTVTDKRGGTTSTYIALTDTREFKTVDLTPRVSTLGVGKTTTFTATAKDQYDRQLLTQPAYEWKVDGVIVTGQAGQTFDYTAPANEGQHTVTATATSGGVAHAATADVTVVGQRPPVLLITSPSTPNDPALPIDIEQDTAVNLVVDDVNDDPVTWYLWLKPTTGNRILVANGNQEVGSAPTQGALAATLSPTVYADGNYTLQLTETDDANAAVVDQRLVRIHSNYKIGSLRLPFVDAQIDVANGTPLTATRVYDSMTSTVDGEFGYGWSLQLNVDPSTFRTTAHSGDYTDNGVPAYRTGDLVYLNTPDGQQHVFAFVPKVIGTSSASGTIGNVASYSPRFVAVDGSRAELTVDQTGTILGVGDQTIALRSNPSTGEWFYSTGTGNLGAPAGYNPSKPAFSSNSSKAFTLTADDGTEYEYDRSGVLQSSKDPNGNEVTYTNGVAADGRQFSIRKSGSHITGISDIANFSFAGTPDPTKFVEYSYDAAGDLVTVRDRSRNVTTFEYEHDENGVSTHRLTKIIDSRGIHLVTASYDPDSHLLTAVADSSGKGTNVVTTPLTDGQSAQSSKDAAGNKSEVIYNDHGDVIREIKQVRDSAGNVTGYEVTLHEYAYGQNNSAAWQQANKFGLTNLNKLFLVRDYAPFTVSGTDTQGLRYSKGPESTAMNREVTFNYIDITSFDKDDADAVAALFQPYQETSRGEDGQLHTTTYHKYYGPGKPAIIESPDGQLTWMLYDSKGRLEYAITGYARNGQANDLKEGTKTEYDTKGRVIGTYQVTATGGAASTLPTVTVGRQLTSSTYYNATSGDGYVDKLASTTNLVTGLKTYYSYYADGQSKAVMREWQQGGVTHQIRDSLTEYDASGRVSRVYDSEDNFTETHYNELGQVDYTVDKFKGKTAMVYDARGQVIRTVYADGTETRTAYDDLGRAVFSSDRFYSGVTIIDAPDGKIVLSAATDVGSLVTRTIYDSLGRARDTERYKNAVIAINTAGLAPEAVAPNASQLLTQGKRISVTSTTYDSQGRVDTTTDAAGSVTKNQYIPNGGLQSVTTAYGTTNASTTAYAYHQTSGTMPATAVYFDAVTDGKQHTTKTYKDANGRAVRVEYHDGSYVDTVYSPTGVAESAYKIRTLNATTGLVEETLPVIPAGGHETVTLGQRKPGDTEPLTWTINVSDAAGRLTDLYLPSPDGVKVSPHWHYDYDANGNLTQQVDPKGHTTSFTYDDRGNRTSRTMPPDSDGNTGNDTESWHYDAFGRMDWHVDFMGQSTKYVYDDTPAHCGRLSEEQRFVGAIDATPDEKTVYDYDDLGRQDGVTEYADGNPSRTTAYAFDPITGGTTQVASPEGVLSHAYDPATGRLTRTWTDSNDTTYDYDKQGRLWKVIATKLNGQTLATPQTTVYTYDAVGNLLSTTQDNGTPADGSDDLVTTNEYDTLNRLDTLVAERGSVVLFDQDYGYTGDGQKHDVLEHRYTSGTISGTTRTTWGYDRNGRLLSESRDEGDDSVQNGGDYTDTYGFDPAGNRVSKVHDAVGTANDASTTSAYNDRDELTASTTNGVTTASTYDANGNTLSDGSRTFTWDLRDRMKSVATNGVTTTYAYDNDGIRISKSTNGTTRAFLNDALNPTGYSKPVEERVNGNVDVSYVIGLSVLGQSNPTTGYLSLVQDGQGKARSVLNVSGVDVQPADYDAYGNTLQPGQTVTPWQNPDGYTDFESGLTRQGVRDLNRTTGTWESRDPTIFGTGEWQDANLHLYAGSDPISNLDPSGNFLAETLFVAAKQMSLRIGEAIKVSPVTIATNRLITWFFINQLKIELGLAVMSLLAEPVFDFVDLAIDRLAGNNEDPVMENGNAGNWIERKIGADAGDDYQTVDKIIDSDGKKNVISVGHTTSLNPSRILQRAWAKVAPLRSGRVITPRDGRQAPTIPGSMIGNRVVIFGIAEEAERFLHDPSFQASLRSMQEEAREVRLFLVPVRRLQGK